jgi:cobaltochelatase CobS
MKQEIKTAFVKTLADKYPGRSVFDVKELVDHANEMGLGYPNFITKPENRVGRGKYQIQMTASVIPMKKVDAQPEVVEQKKVTQTVFDQLKIEVPEKDKSYVSWGFFRDVKQIVESMAFYPLFIAGLSGNGKTMMVEQACAQTKRKYVRVNITEESDEDDLIGGFRLINGETVWCDGPIPQAMKQGAVCLIDEIDRGSNKLMCLQAVLEGKPLYIKKTGEVVRPEQGFNIIATANTKGRGSEDGRFTGARILDEAFLERFVATMDQPYPTTAVEKKIILNAMEEHGKLDGEFAENLVTWSDIIRTTYKDGGVDDLISTRRLVHIARTYGIFGDRAKAIELCISRFDEDTRVAFLDLYTKVDSKATSTIQGIEATEVIIDEAKDIAPF